MGGTSARGPVYRVLVAGSVYATQGDALQTAITSNHSMDQTNTIACVDVRRHEYST